MRNDRNEGTGLWVKSENGKEDFEGAEVKTSSWAAKKSETGGDCSTTQQATVPYITF